MIRKKAKESSPGQMVASMKVIGSMVSNMVKDPKLKKMVFINAANGKKARELPGFNEDYYNITIKHSITASLHIKKLLGE